MSIERWKQKNIVESKPAPDRVPPIARAMDLRPTDRGETRTLELRTTDKGVIVPTTEPSR